MSRALWIFIILISVGLVGLSIFEAVRPNADVSGWVQVGIAALGVPILLRELNQIREAINRKPKINIGLANVNDLPLSKVRNAKALHTTKDISRGYPHFELVVRNNGSVTAKSIKIHFEFVSRAPKENSLAVPVLECVDWRKDDRFTFKKVNNADFVFIGGANWVLHANDSDMFPFHMTTTLGKKDGERERPDYGKYEFECTVWADGLDKPVQEKLIVNVVEKI
ncbi:MAG TPA: hypothetical protein DCG54_09925 [Anaerolineae bacterium]|jgi:hypothetical protein|nr:hypothetical protein [Anaerolineae bacterium]